MFAVLTVPLSYSTCIEALKLGRARQETVPWSWRGGALMSAFLVAVHASQVVQGRTARMYAQGILLAALTSWPRAPADERAGNARPHLHHRATPRLYGGCVYWVQAQCNPFSGIGCRSRCECWLTAPAADTAAICGNRPRASTGAARWHKCGRRSVRGHRAGPRCRPAGLG